ncbi:hypothetical protein DV515_00018375, partial [Chloebia gouldiae]
FSGDRGRTPKVAGAVHILIHSTPAPRISRGVIGLRPTPAPDGRLRQDLKDEPLDTADWELFTDGSSFVENGTRYAGYSVVTVFQVIEARALTPGTSAQKAEIIGLTRALILSAGRKVNIWTDSKYAFGVVHIHGALWRERGLLSSQGTAIKHREEVVALLDAVHKPEQVAVMHVRGHQKEDGKIFRGNRLADPAAREVARQVWTQMALIPTRTNPANPYLQQPLRYSREDEKLAALLKANKNATGWYVTNTGQVVVPSWIMKAILVAEHNKSHWGAEALVKFLKGKIVSNQKLSLAKRVNAMCPVCLKNNPVVRKQIQLGRLQVGPEPGDYWQVDFSELPKAQGNKTNQAKEVIKTLLKEIISRFGVPLGLSSDRGPHFIAHIVQEIARVLDVTWNLHTPWRPQSSGQVERMNRTLKSQIKKICQEGKMQWPQALPLALLQIRIKPRERIGVSPYEILYGKPYHASTMKGDPHIIGEQ